MLWVSRRTFSCFRCLSSLSSRYVRFDSTGVLNGFMIFFTATACPVSWSLAELHGCQLPAGTATYCTHLTIRAQRLPCPPAASPCICSTHQCLSRSETAPQSSWSIAPQPAYLLVISKVVPKIWARTNSAILPDIAAQKPLIGSVEV